MARDLITLILLVLFSFSAFADVEWNIDCGESDAYYDNDINWQGDKSLIGTGTIQAVSYTGYTFLQSARVFKSGKKNCYVLAGEKGVKVIVLASFFYGNFDGKSSPPTFGMQIDGNDWGEVVTNMDTDHYVTMEAVYVTKGDAISVCLVQTHANQYPFISALQVRTLGSKMYSSLNPDQALSNVNRYSYGGSDEVRDGDLRIWTATTLPGDSYTSAQSDASSIDTSTAIDNPPVDVVRNAMTPSNDSAQSLVWSLTDLDATPSLVSMILYFSEVTSLSSTDKRAFSVHLDDKLLKDSVTPRYGGVTELSIFNATASKSSTIKLTSTPDSTLPPIINSMELFLVINYTLYSPGPKSSPKKKSGLPVILGISLPSIFVLVAFVVVLFMIQQKRNRAAIAMTATPGVGVTGKSQGAANGNNNYNNNNGTQMMGAASAQGMRNELNGDVEGRTTATEDSNYIQHDQYRSPDPLLSQTH